ncbi:glycoside hydrolase family 65 protein [Mollisia scopiformis]|uniref:alpha,alpha-trehalase n=1 Tax=Mollisia scopiformis TaxID=149040 RepID=A0A194WW77_MOLSC|nr:glycoside hydrolase family 65 protein [Mollisia scopiformis]KUJ11837.1 glycoside hydrolase family 65 protein [Mollisia scopiformis]
MATSWARIFALLLLDLGVQAATDFSVTTSGIYSWNQSDWSLTATKFIPGQFQSRMSLANGYVGASLAAAGPFFETDVNQTDPNGIQPSNGWPLFDTRISFSTISGFYDVQPNGTGTNYPWLNQYGWESFISGIPHPTAIIFAFGDNYLDATVSNTTISNFASKISFQTGVGEWSYTWSPESSSAAFNVSYSALFSRARPNVIAVKASITPSASISGTVTDLLDGSSAARSYLDTKGIDTNGSTIYSSVHPNGLANITGYVVSGANFSNAYTNSSSRAEATGPFVGDNSTTIGQTYNISLKAGETATFFKFVGVASNDKFADVEEVARQAQSTAQEDGWDALLSEHVAAWAEIMTSDKVDNFTDPATGRLPDSQDIEILQIASVANTYYLLQSIQPDGSGLNDNSVSVGGLVSDSYAGLVFWDADYWMAPGLNLAFPSYSKQISNFRIKQHPQALANAAFNNYPNNSALYSWTAGRYGNCTGTGPCVDYEYHLNYDIAFNLLQQYNVTNNETWFNAGPRQVIESAAIMTGHLLQYNETTKSYWLHNMTDPDEYANNVDNGAFTIASAAELLRVANALRVQQGLEVNSTWETQWQGIEFPTAPSNITLEYQTMNNSVAVKQADVVLLTYPLDYGEDYTADDKLLDLDYYANKQSPNGPAMTYSVFAVDANALSPSGCSAYTYTLNGFLPYLRAPFFQFSEQAIDDVTLNGNTNPAYPFLTGHGGANQVVPFGFLGIRTDQPMLYINPSLPPQIPYIKIRTFHYAGAALQATMNSTHTNLTRISSTSLTDLYQNTTLPLTVGTPNSPSSQNTNYTLSTNQTLTIPNRLYWQTLTHANNLLQCQPVTSPDAYAAGQFPTAAIDGATATRWQPASNASASLLVNTTSITPSLVSGLYFDWGARPPRSATVYLGNSTTVNGENLTGEEIIIQVGGIAPSLPFVAAEAEASAQEVQPVVGNSTTVAVEGGAWSGGYVRLVVEGCWEEDGEGATVGEFVVIGG